MPYYTLDVLLYQVRHNHCHTEMKRQNNTLEDYLVWMALSTYKQVILYKIKEQET